MQRPCLESSYFKKAWEVLLNSKAFKNNEIHMFWRKISFHTQEFIVNLWKGVDQAIDDYYAEGELVMRPGPFHVRHQEYYVLRQEVRRFEALYLQNSQRAADLLGILLYTRPELIFDTRFLRRYPQIGPIQNFSLPRSTTTLAASVNKPCWGF